MEVTESVDVLLFKSIHEINDTNNDPYFKKLKEAHVSVELIQPLQYSYKNLDDLTDALATPHILSGIFLTIINYNYYILQRFLCCEDN